VIAPQRAPVLPEQPTDWTEPGAFPVTSGVWRIPLPLPSASLRAVNVYAAEAAEGIVLVDAGWSGPDGLSALRHGLGEIGRSLHDVVGVVVTHAHHDHYTQALDLRDRCGATVMLGRGEQASVEAFARARTEPAPQPALLRRAGAPGLADDMTALVEATFEEVDAAPWGTPDRWLDDHEQLTLGPRGVEVVRTPGHTRGHIVLRDAEAGALFAGDHVLPHITPSIGYERAPEPAPLRSFLDSLRLVGEMPETLLLPAHGPVRVGVRTRVDELLAHHEQRLDEARRHVAEGASTAYEVAARMRWTSRGKRLDELETEHAALAVLEIATHLDLLVEQGALAAQEDDGVVHHTPR
jgi:glyoxylase-like metal-dependent hydrolase (beta-lactamase superfamily II)